MKVVDVDVFPLTIWPSRDVLEAIKDGGSVRIRFNVGMSVVDDERAIGITLSMGQIADTLNAAGISAQQERVLRDFHDPYQRPSIIINPLT